MFRHFDAKLKLEYKNESAKKKEKKRTTAETKMIRVREEGERDRPRPGTRETEEGGWHKKDLEKCQRMEREDLLLPEFFSGSKLGNI